VRCHQGAGRPVRRRDSFHRCQSPDVKCKSRPPGPTGIPYAIVCPGKDLRRAPRRRPSDSFRAGRCGETNETCFPRASQPGPTVPGSRCRWRQHRQRLSYRCRAGVVLAIAGSLHGHDGLPPQEGLPSSLPRTPGSGCTASPAAYVARLAIRLVVLDRTHRACLGRGGACV
jgi:hypothetical protein